MDDLSCKQRSANIVAMEMLKNCKSAQTKAQYYGIQKTTSERSEWFHKNKFDIMMAWMTPVSLHFSDVPTGSNNLNRQTTLGYWFRAFATNNFSRRTVVQINLWTQWMIPQKQVRYHDGMDDTCFTAFLRCPYRIEQSVQTNNTWLLI